MSDFSGLKLNIHPRSFAAEGVRLIGAVTLEEGASVWYNSVLRADLAAIVIGRDSNIQDNCTLHVEQDKPTVVGSRVTVGHGAILHACTVEDDCLIGMGAVLLDGVRIRKSSLVAAGSVIPPGKSFPEGSLILGSPASVARKLSEAEVRNIVEAAGRYRGFWEDYKQKGIALYKK
jgi:carbonic anhydrase/acetyltransferase-like protein (isoleucine patch superfamily)